MSRPLSRPVQNHVLNTVNLQFKIGGFLWFSFPLSQLGETRVSSSFSSFSFSLLPLFPFLFNQIASLFARGRRRLRNVQIKLCSLRSSSAALAACRWDCPQRSGSSCEGQGILDSALIAVPSSLSLYCDFFGGRGHLPLLSFHLSCNAPPLPHLCLFAAARHPLYDPCSLLPLPPSTFLPPHGPTDPVQAYRDCSSRGPPQFCTFMLQIHAPPSPAGLYIRPSAPALALGSRGTSPAFRRLSPLPPTQNERAAPEVPGSSCPDLPPDQLTCTPQVPPAILSALGGQHSLNNFWQVLLFLCRWPVCDCGSQSSASRSGNCLSPL